MHACVVMTACQVVYELWYTGLGSECIDDDISMMQNAMCVILFMCLPG